MQASSLNRFLAPLRRRILGYMARALITTVSEANEIQDVQIDLGNSEIKDNIKRVQDFGFTSNPLKGAQAVVLFHGGNRDHGLVLACDDGRYRLKVSPGEVAMYNAFGSKVTLKANGNIEVNAAAKVVVNGATGIELIGVPAGVPVPVVLQTSLCAFTGGPHPQGSSNVKASP